MIRVGLVGVGAMGSGHLANYLRLMREGKDIKLVAICDVRPEQLERKENNDLNIEIKHESFQADYNKYTSFKKMLDSEEMDYVDFAVPTYLHRRNGGRRAGTRLPCAVRKADGDERAAVREHDSGLSRSGKTLMVAQCLRFWPAYEELKRIVDSGEWGRVVSGMFFRGGDTPKWSFLRIGCARRTRAAACCSISTSTMSIPSTGSSARRIPSPPAPLNVIPGSGYDAVSTNYYYPDGKVINAMDDWTINGARV